MAALAAVGTWAEERVQDRDSWMWILLLHRERYPKVAIQN